MKKSCLFLSLIICLFFNHFFINGATIQPIERTVGRLKISIDPRMELLAAIQAISKNQDLVNKSLPYSKEIISNFESFSSQEVIKLTEDLQQKYGFGADAPVVFMLHLSQPGELEEQTKFSDYILGRSGAGDNLEQYRKSIKQFAETSNFEKFWNNKIPFYNQILDMTIANMGEIDLVETLEGYFNETQDSYNIIITPAFNGGKGPKVPDADGKEHTYACISTNSIEDGIPFVNEGLTRYLVWHEFGHSFVNSLTNKYSDQVMSVEKLFNPIKNSMFGQGYQQWIVCVYEHIIRATTIRLFDIHLGSKPSKDLLDSELNNRYIYIEPLVEKLKDFDKQRDENNITFSEFYPELLIVFDSLLKTEYWKNFNLNFQGPANAVMAEKMSIIYPTQDTDKEALKIAQDMASQFFNNFPPDMCTLLADTAALQADLSEQGIFAFGTIESNLFLKHYASTFPFKIENQTIYADKEYKDKDIQFISCVPNPQNPMYGMLIFTALSNKRIHDIFNMTVLSFGGDYFLFLNDGTVLGRGFYNNKNDKWTFL